MAVGLAERDMAEAIAAQEWLEPIDQVLGKLVSSAFEAAGPAGPRIKNFLHGTWLGHPLHVALTDAPIGAWTTALVLDMVESLGGNEEVGPGADAAVAFGVVGALGAALAGLTDWSATYGRGRKVGLLHGLLNIGVTGIYGASLLCRRQGARGAGRALGLAGFALANYTAWLGGDLVYRERIGVDHSQTIEHSPPEDFVPALPASELPDGELRKGDAAGLPVVLVRLGGWTYALSDTCAHLGCSLSDGKLEGDSVRCGCHGSRYALEDGRVLDGPATMPQPAFETRVRNGQIEVRAAQQ
jgi:nitrite reductase/ring-hydroxylating ferredoxin subunit/uncharacterized membrane protein